MKEFETKVLVTGAGGFIGNQICQDLRGSRIPYIALYRSSNRPEFENNIQLEIQDFQH